MRGRVRRIDHADFSEQIYPGISVYPILDKAAAHFTRLAWRKGPGTVRSRLDAAMDEAAPALLDADLLGVGIGLFLDGC